MTTLRRNATNVTATVMLAAASVTYLLGSALELGVGSPDLSRFFGRDRSSMISRAIDIIDLALSWWGFAMALAVAGAAAFLVATAKYFAKKYGKRYAINWLATQ